MPGETPNVSIVDTFTRGDENPATGWAASMTGGLYSSNRYRIISNRLAAPPGLDADSVFGSRVYRGDLDVVLQVGVVGFGGEDITIQLYGQNVGAAFASYSSIEIVWRPTGPSVSIYRRSMGGGATFLNGVFSGTAFADGDRLWVKTRGPLIQVFALRAAVGTDWVLMASTTETLTGREGRIGLAQNNGNVTFRSFGIGELSSPGAVEGTTSWSNLMRESKLPSAPDRQAAVTQRDLIRKLEQGRS